MINLRYKMIDNLSNKDGYNDGTWPSISVSCASLTNTILLILSFIVLMKGLGVLHLPWNHLWGGLPE